MDDTKLAAIAWRIGLILTHCEDWSPDVLDEIADLYYDADLAEADDENHFHFIIR